MEGAPKSTLPDIGEKRGPALRSDQTRTRSRDLVLFAFLPPLALASLCAIKAEPNPPHHCRHHHPQHRRQQPTLKTPLAREHPIFFQRSCEHEGDKNVRGRLVANDQNDPEARSRRSSIYPQLVSFGNRQTDFVFARTPRRCFLVRPCVI